MGVGDYSRKRNLNINHPNPSLLKRGIIKFADSHYFYIMEETHSAKAIILDRKPFKEHDTMVSVFCLDKGKLDLVARGTKKISSKLAGHIEPVTLSNIMIARGRQYDYLAAAINEESFINIKNDFDKISAAGQAVGVFKKLVKGEEKDEAIFKLFESFLRLLNKGELSVISYELLLNFFILKLLSQLGYKPELYNCAVCKKKIVPNNNKFDLAKGGVVCGGCAIESPIACSAERSSCWDKGAWGDLLTITDNCVKVLRMIVNSDFDKLLKLKIDNELNREVNLIISSFYKYNF